MGATVNPNPVRSKLTLTLHRLQNTGLIPSIGASRETALTAPVGRRRLIRYLVVALFGIFTWMCVAPSDFLEVEIRLAPPGSNSCVPEWA